MRLLDHKAEFSGQEVVTDKGHQEDEVIDNGLDIIGLDRLQTLFELFSEVLS